MKKLFSFVALCLCALAVQAVPSITITPNDVDFGTVSIKGKTSVEDSVQFDVTYSGLLAYCGVEYEDVESEMPAKDAAFWISGTKTNGWIYGGDEYNPAEGKGLWVHYYAEKAGTYTGKFKFYTYNSDADWGATPPIPGTLYYMTVKVVVSADAIVEKTIDFERVNSTSGLADDDVIVFVSESAGAVSGALNSTYLEAMTENVTIDKTQGKAKVPEKAQMFSVKKYSGNWQFTTTDTKKRLHLDITGKGAFTYADPVAGEILANWGVSISSSGVAEVSKPDGTFPVEFNGNRFKPYKSAGSGTAIAIYKKVGTPEELQSKVTINPTTVTFEDCELDEQQTITIAYTAENLTDDIIWVAEGTDGALFEVTETGDRTSGTVTIKYLGTGTKTGAVSAKVSYLTQNAQLDPMEGSYDINLTLLAKTTKLTKLEFNSSAPTSIDQGQTIDLSPYIVYTPNDAADKSLTWATDHDYQGTITEDGKLTAKHVTGNIVVTATSKKVPSVYATLTLTITKPTITDFTLSDSEINLNVGGTHTLSVTAFVPAYASETPTYSSDLTSVATVNKSGVITAKGLGDATITATIGTVSKTCIVHVKAVAVNSITFDKSEANLTLGSTMQLTPIVDPAQAASEYTIGYTSNNEAVATVSSTGVVSSVAVGDADITADINGKTATITIHVVAAATFAKVTDPSILAEKDTIILALKNTVVAGKRDDKKLTVITTEITATDTEAYADNACRMVLGTEKGKDGFTLTIVGATKPIAVASNDNDIVDANTKNCKFWGFEADGTNGYYVTNLGNTNVMFKYHASNAAIKPYKTSTTGAVFVYAYFRKYVNPVVTGIEEMAAPAEKAQKILRDGQIIIIRNGVEYSIDGKRL